MSDLIDREKLIADLNKFAPEHYTALVNNIITQQPSASRPTGEWERHELWEQPWYTCSVCNYHGRNDYNFCPSCGADMRGADE